MIKLITHSNTGEFFTAPSEVLYGQMRGTGVKYSYPGKLILVGIKDQSLISNLSKYITKVDT